MTFVVASHGDNLRGPRRHEQFHLIQVIGFISLIPFSKQVSVDLPDLVILEDSIGYNLIMRKANVSGDPGNLLPVGRAVPGCQQGNA